MKQICSALVVLLLVMLSPKTSNGAHVLGTYITYEYVAPNEFLVRLTYYRDCTGISAPTDSVTACYSSVSAGVNGNMTLMALPGTGTQCPQSNCWVGPGPSSCTGGTAFGVEEYIYEGSVILPQAASDWIFSYYDCCGIGSSTFTSMSSYVYATLDNLNFPVNSSPHFITPPYFLYCLNALSTLVYSCTDTDGDSLVYMLADGLDGTSCQSTNPYAYLPPYSGAYPISSSTPIQVDSVNGVITFTPNLQMFALFGLMVREYRGGVPVGEVLRDHVLIVQNGIISSVTEPSGISNVKVFPNPAGASMSIEMNLETATNIQMELFNSMGELVDDFENGHHTGYYKKDISVDHLLPGLYFLKISTGQSISVVKVIIE